MGDDVSPPSPPSPLDNDGELCKGSEKGRFFFFFWFEFFYLFSGVYFDSSHFGADKETKGI